MTRTIASRTLLPFLIQAIGLALLLLTASPARAEEGSPSGPPDPENEASEDALPPDEGASARTPAEAEEAPPPLVEAVIIDLPMGVTDPRLWEKVKEARSGLPIRVGEPFTMERVQETIQIFFRTGLFLQVKVYEERRESGVTVRILLIPRWVVNQVLFVGHRHLAEKELARVQRLRPGDMFFLEDLEHESHALRDLYRRSGFPNATIRATTIPTPVSYRVNVRFDIEEGSPRLISRIDFLGDPFFDAKTLRRKFGLNPGDRLSLENVDAKLKKLKEFYTSQGFEEADLKLVENPDDPASPMFRTGVLQLAIQARNRIVIRFTGNERYSPRSLSKGMGLGKEYILSYDANTLERLRENLVLFYLRRGYLNVRIKTSVVIEESRRIKQVIFSIREGFRVELRRISFEGSRHFTSKQLREELLAFVRDRLYQNIEEESESMQPMTDGSMEFRPYPFESRGRQYSRQSPPPYYRPGDLDVDQVYIPTIYEEGALAVEQYYREHGFLSCRIEGPFVAFNATGQRVEVTYRVTEGVQTTVGEIQIAGNAHVPREEILARTGLKPEAPLNDLLFEEQARLIRESYVKNGYLYARASIRFTLSDDHRRAVVLIDIYEGPQVKVGEILISGNRQTKSSTIRRELTFKEGDVYQPKDAEDSQYWLNKLGLFQAVTLRPWNPEKEEETKKIEVVSVERKPGRVELGGGVATDEGVRFKFGFVFRNLLGEALEFHFSARLNHRIPALLDAPFERLYEKLSFAESLERDITFGVYYPSLVGTHIGFRTDFRHLRRQERAYGLDKNSFSFSFDYEIIRYATFAQINEFYWQDSQRTTLPSLREGEIVPPDGKTWEYSPKLQGLFDWRDSKFNPTKGIVISALAEYFQTIAGSLKVDLFRGSGFIAGYIPIPILRRPPVLKLTFRGGGIAKPSNYETPVDKRFKLGGRTSLRGFGEDAIYPADLSANQIAEIRTQKLPSPGGDAFLLFKLDLRLPVYRNYYLGAFLDSGNLWITPSHMDLRVDKYRNSAGGGIHYRTAVGDINLEVGWNLNPNHRLAEESWRFHFSINLF